MNRNNIWIHIGIAVVIVTMAAVLGQIRRWENSLRAARNQSGDVMKTVPKPASLKRSAADSEPEVLVRFRPGVSLAQIRSLAARNNDRVEDEIESVKGLVAIDDLDNADSADVAKQYAAMADLVSYAEPNFQISLDDPDRAAVLAGPLVPRTRR